jgi:hypothetical protein
MSDILIFHSPGRRAAAAQMEEALAASGLESAPRQIGEGEGAAIAGAAGGAPACLLIWSRELASAAVTEGWLAKVRQLPNLIEVSMDGITPQAGDESRIVLLSGWRGQPFHLGWRKVQDELQRLCGARKPVPQRRRDTKPAPAAAADPDAAEQMRKGGPRRLALPALAALGLAATAGAAAWIAAPSPRADQERPMARQEGQSPPAPDAPSAPMPVPQAAPPVEPVPATAAPARGAAPLATPSRPVAVTTRRTAASAKTKRPRAPARSAVSDSAPKRYSKRNSKTMRLFCARSGRSTPQCGTFLKSVRASD